MPKHGLILVNAYAPELYTRQVSRLKEELERRSAIMEVKRNNEFSANIKNSRTDIAFPYDFCVFLDKDKYISHMLEKAGVRLFNTARAVEICDDKMTTHIALADSGIPMPDTLPAPLCYDKTAKPDAAMLDAIERKLGYPVIVKAAFGSLGNGVFKADDRAELEYLCEQLKLQPHLFQKYISASHGKDMRVIVIGGKVIGGMIRRSDNGDFRSNIGLGGSAEASDVPQDIRSTAEKAASILRLDYCGIDFLLGDTPMLCEVNSNAYFDAFENATGINVAAKYAEHILSETGE